MLSTLKHPWLMKKNNPGSGSTTKVPVGIIKCIVKDTCHEIDLVCVSFFSFFLAHCGCIGLEGFHLESFQGKAMWRE